MSRLGSALRACADAQRVCSTSHLHLHLSLHHEGPQDVIVQFVALLRLHHMGGLLEGAV